MFKKSRKNADCTVAGAGSVSKIAPLARGIQQFSWIRMICFSFPNHFFEYDARNLFAPLHSRLRNPRNTTPKPPDSKDSFVSHFKLDRVNPEKR
jgi:hypothetical protein